jgi:amino acid transporter
MTFGGVKQLILGKRLQTADLPHQAISRPVGLAVFASDALSSTAYATEEILLILSLALGGGATIWLVGGTTLGLSIPIAIGIAILLTIVTISYRQTIYAYPNGGGAYIVARDNLGEVPAQIAGAALLTDYILTVAVSISSGVAQIVSAFPALLPYRVGIAVAVIFFMTVVNLRGVKESGRLFAIPTYFFLTMILFTLAVGFIRALNGELPTVEGVEAIHHDVVEPLTLFLVLRAFSSGCTALTGIEAISNGITAFKQPRSHNAAVTLIWMSSILIVLFLGITFLANQIHAVPSHSETIISQMGRAVHGDGSPLYFLLLSGTALVLLMAANTAYADFPRLAALHAGDGFLPRQLTYRGGRLVFSWGIVVLAVFASLLVIIANARTSALIPLYAVGVFLSFTISQTGMVIHLRDIGKLKPGEVVKGLETELHYDKNWRLKQIISAVGAVCTFVVMCVFAVTKFADGAWLVVILIPTLVMIFFRIHRHYKEVAQSLSRENTAALDSAARSVQTVILIDNVHAETVKMVNFAKSLQHPWKAVHIGINPDRVESVREKWQTRIGEGELVVIDSPLRLLAEPIRDYIQELQTKNPGCFVHIIMGHLVMDTFWEQALHQNSAFIFTLALGDLENVAVTSVPYQIHHMKHPHGRTHSLESPVRRATQEIGKVTPPVTPPAAETPMVKPESAQPEPEPLSPEEPKA